MQSVFSRHHLTIKDTFFFGYNNNMSKGCRGENVVKFVTCWFAADI